MQSASLPQMSRPSPGLSVAWSPAGAVPVDENPIKIKQQLPSMRGGSCQRWLSEMYGCWHLPSRKVHSFLGTSWSVWKSVQITIHYKTK